MNRAEIDERWLANKEFLDVRSLGNMLRTTPDGAYYACPCGGEDHHAWRPLEDFGTTRSPASILTCFVTGRQWVIQTNMGEIVREEEAKAIALIDRAEKVIGKVLRKRAPTEETARYLLDTHGIPLGMSQDYFKEHETSVSNETSVKEFP